MSVEKTLEKLLRGASDANIRFDEICDLLPAKGFRMRVSGSHHIFKVWSRGTHESAARGIQGKAASKTGAKNSRQV
jgi:hypothetical protein